MEISLYLMSLLKTITNSTAPMTKKTFKLNFLFIVNRNMLYRDKDCFLIHKRIIIIKFCVPLIEILHRSAVRVGSDRIVVGIFRCRSGSFRCQFSDFFNAGQIRVGLSFAASGSLLHVILKPYFIQATNSLAKYGGFFMQ